MGPVSEFNLKTAPGIYNTQVNLGGSFKAYFRHNKRKTLKIGLVVLFCATSSTINVMFAEDYSSASFI